MATLQENVNQAINDFNNIKQAIIEKGVGVPNGTPTSQYGESIRAISTGVDTSQDTVVAAALRAGFTAHEASGAAITGIIQNYEGAIVSGATPGAQAKYEEGYADGQASMPDLSKDTVTPDKLVLGETAHDASGQPITGTLDTEAIRAEGVEAGKKSEYDAFWNAYQLGGSRDYNYDYAFAGNGWLNANFKPKYNMKPLRCQQMFSSSAISGDLEQILAEYGVSLDTSLSTLMTNFATYASAVTVFPTIDISSVTGEPNLFQGCSSMVKLRLVSSGDIKISASSFRSCSALADLTIEGVLASANLNLSWSPLNKASLISVINALSDTTTGLPVTVRASAVKKAFETSEGANDGMSSEEWLQLIATKPNWTINTIDS